MAGDSGTGPGEEGEGLSKGGKGAGGRCGGVSWPAAGEAGGTSGRRRQQ